MPISQLLALHETFMTDFVYPMFLPKARDLIAQHKSAGDYCLIMSATNSFITRPIAQALEVDDILSTDLEVENGFYTGAIVGTPCFQGGKVQRLHQWLAETNRPFDLLQSTFYSDSINDLPLLKEVGVAVAVDPDKKLRQLAQANNWQIISLRQ
jgi:HAD superfamily hydrolase (TIGR01490 family)